MRATTSILFLLSVFFVIVNCEKKQDEKLEQPFQRNPDFGSISGKSDDLMEPNLFKKIGSHIAKGWHGFRSLFGRKSNRREENIYGNERREENQRPEYGKEPSLNKETHEINYYNNKNNNNNNNGNIEPEKQFLPGNEKKDREGFEDRIIGGYEEKPRSQEEFGLEESNGKPLRPSEQKSSEPGQEVEFGKIRTKRNPLVKKALFAGSVFSAGRRFGRRGRGRGRGRG